MASLAVNTLVYNRYRIVRLVGQGGMGAVYEAFDQSLRIPVALKQLLMNDPQIATVFAREAHLLAGLRHSALPRMIDYFEYANEHFLVMEFIPGDDLAAQLTHRGQAFPIQQVLRWGDQLLKVVEYLHNRQPPLIHRDIKPQNLKLGDDGELILLDFGLAKGTQAVTRIASAPSIISYTPQYAPLEQIQGANADPRTDLFAVGATLYHLATGQSPTDALTRAAALVTKQSDPLKASRALNSLIPPHVDAILTQALALAPEDRPASAAAMRQALMAPAAPAIGATVVINRPTAPAPVVAQTPAAPAASKPVVAQTPATPVAPRPVVVAKPTATSQSGWRSSVPKSAWVVIGLLIALIVTIVSLSKPTSAPVAQVPTSAPAAPAATPTPQLSTSSGMEAPISRVMIAPEQLDNVVELARWGEGDVRYTYTSPDHRWFVSVGNFRAVVMALPTFEVQTIIDLPSAPSVNWSRSNPYIAISNEIIALALTDGTARIWRLADGQQIDQIGGPDDSVVEIALSRDQRLLASLHRGEEDYSLRWWRVNDGELQQQVTLPKQDFYRGMRFQENDQYIAVEGAIFTDDGLHSVNITTIDIRSGELKATNNEPLSTNLHLLAKHQYLDLSIYVLENGQIAIQTPQSMPEVLQIAKTSIWNMVLHPTRPIAAFLTNDDSILIWDLNQQRQLIEIPDANRLTFSPDGTHFATFSRDYGINIWRLDDLQLERTINTDQDGTLLFNDNTHISIINNDTIQSWNIEDGTLQATNEHNLFSGSIWETTISPDHTKVAIGGSDYVEVHDLINSTILFKAVPDTVIRGLAFMPDNRTLAIAYPLHISLVNQAGVVLRTIPIKYVIGIAITPDGQTLVAAVEDGSIELRNIHDGTLQRTIQAHDEHISKLLITPDGQLLISSSYDNTAKIWQLSNGSLLHTLHHTADINDIELFSSGRYLVTASDDETIGVWNTADGSQINSLRIGYIVWRVAVNPVTQLVALSSYSEDIALWSLADKRELTYLTGHRDQIQSLDFTRGGNLLISTSSDGTVRLWGVPEW